VTSAAERSRTPGFNVLAGTDRTRAGMFRGEMPVDASLWQPVEVAEQAAAFDTNPRTAAGRRKYNYLLATRNGSSIVAATLRQEYEEESTIGKNRTAIQFMAATQAQNTYAQRALASTVLTGMAEFYSRNRETLLGLIDAKAAECSRYMERLSRAKTGMAGVRETFDLTSRKTADAFNIFSGSRAKTQEIEKQLFEASGMTAALENRSIKIVRSNLRSIADLRKSLTSEETQAPEIYIVAGRGKDGVTTLYDRVTMGADGRIAIERIPEGAAPDMLKSEDEMLTDMFERVYYRPDGKGGMELVRMEYGMNGPLMGPVGRISDRMMDQFMAATGKKPQDLTTDAASYEARYRARNELIEENHAACAVESHHAGKYERAREKLAKAKDAFESRNGHIETLERECKDCHGKLESLRKTLEHTDRRLAHIASAQGKLDSHEIADIDDIRNKLPTDFTEEFMHFYNALPQAEAPEMAAQFGAATRSRSCQMMGGLRSAWDEVMMPVPANDLPLFTPRPALLAAPALNH